ncbi:MAG: hypothetical protein H6840_00925 [Planctomycetes bacterium]|nr:hypothetical protein [Planctomycetota bacterium]
MELKAIVGAIAGGLLGAIGWTAVVIGGEAEFKLMAWGVGGLIAGGAILAGGRGQTMGGVCALVTMGAILTAKLFIAAHLTQLVEEDAAAIDFSTAHYNHFMRDAKDWQKVEGNTVAFLTEHKNYEWQANGRLDSTDYEVFDEFWAPRLSAWAASPPPFETWKPRIEADLRELQQHRAGYLDQLKAVTGPWDLGFIFVGIVTAFGLVAGRGEPPARQRHSAAPVIDYSVAPGVPTPTKGRPASTRGIDPQDQPPGMR